MRVFSAYSCHLESIGNYMPIYPVFSVLLYISPSQPSIYVSLHICIDCAHWLQTDYAHTYVTTYIYTHICNNIYIYIHIIYTCISMYRLHTHTRILHNAYVRISVHHRWFWIPDRGIHHSGATHVPFWKVCWFMLPHLTRYIIYSI